MKHVVTNLQSVVSTSPSSWTMHSNSGFCQHCRFVYFFPRKKQRPPVIPVFQWFCHRKHGILSPFTLQYRVVFPHQNANKISQVWFVFLRFMLGISWSCNNYHIISLINLIITIFICIQHIQPAILMITLIITFTTYDLILYTIYVYLY